MFCDLFNRKEATKLLEGKRIWFMGSSNMRAIYKDCLWLIRNETVSPRSVFKSKNELSYQTDKRLSNDTLHNGREYKETRVFRSKKTEIFYHFLTRLYLNDFCPLFDEIAKNKAAAPDFLFINSCLWDLTRWGPSGPEDFKVNLVKTMQFLKQVLPAKTRVVWKTTLPVSTKADGAIFVEDVKDIVPLLPWHIMEANHYAAQICHFFNFDVLDVHHYMRLQGYLRVKDGIHWDPVAIRYLTNIFLTHIALALDVKLPGVLNARASVPYLAGTTRPQLAVKELNKRVQKKEALFKRLLHKIKSDKNKVRVSGIKNKFLSVKKAAFKPKRNKPNYHLDKYDYRQHDDRNNYPAKYNFGRF